nr:hypothetical protein GCM10020185_57040 [Pseudomonas brassicacearum subsp. brassicacearum]
MRIEQLYPFPEEDLMEAIAPYTNLTHVVWCQEEPMNQGAWYSSQHHLRRSIGNHNKALVLEYAGRDASAAPACGYASMHAEQQEKNCCKMPSLFNAFALTETEFLRTHR